MSEVLGRNIKAIRKMRNMTQERLATLIGSKTSYIWKMENNTPADPSARKLLQIAEIMEVSLDLLFSEQLPTQKITLEKGNSATIEMFENLDQKRKSMVREYIKLIS